MGRCPDECLLKCSSESSTPSPAVAGQNPWKSGPRLQGERSNWPATALSHLCFLFPFRKGKCCPFLLFCFSCSARCPQAVLRSYFSLRVAAWNKFLGANFVFCGRWLSCVFRWCFASVFWFYGVVPRSRNCSKMFMSGLLFWVRSLFLRFLVDVVFVSFFKKNKSGRTHPRTCTFLVCCFFCPRCCCVLTRFGRASLFFCVLLGCLSGPVRFVHFLDPLGTLGGLRLLAPSETLFLDGEPAWVFVVDFFCCFCFPFCCVCGCFTQTRRVVPSSYVPDPGSSPRRRARGLWTPFGLRFFVIGKGSQGPSDARRPGPFCWGGGVRLPPQVTFHTHVFVPTRVFFPFSLLAFEAPNGLRDAY